MARFLAGFNARATIGPSPSVGAAYAFATFRIRSTTVRLDVSNTEGLVGAAGIVGSALGNQWGITNGPIFVSRLPGQTSFEANIRQATFDQTNNPFNNPYRLLNGFYYNINVFYTTNGPTWNCPFLLMGEIDSDGDVRGLEPFSFTGESDGAFTIG
jgi:hypothetical protein